MLAGTAFCVVNIWGTAEVSPGVQSTMAYTDRKRLEVTTLYEPMRNRSPVPTVQTLLGIVSILWGTRKGLCYQSTQSWSALVDAK